MSKKIQLPNGVIVEAPDDATDEEMDAIATEAYGSLLTVNAEKRGLNTPQPQEDKSFLGGLGEGAMHVVGNAASYLDKGIKGLGIDLDAAGQAIGLPSVDETNAQTKQFFDGRDTTASNVGNFIGETAATMALTRGMGGPVTQGALGGALVSDAKDATGVATGMAAGAVGGKVGDLAMRGIASAVAPKVNSKVAALLAEGVPLTPGQIVGQGGRGGRTVKYIEDAASNLPIVGTAIRGARQRGNEAFVKAATNRTLAPIGQKLPDGIAAGHEGVEFAQNALSQAYNQVLPKLSGTLDRQMAQRVVALRQRASVPAKYTDDLNAVMEDAKAAFQAGQNGAYSGRTLRDASEKLGDTARSLAKSDDPYLRRVGEFAAGVREQMHALARRQNPADAQALRNIDKGYASLVRVERAAAGANDGVFAPGQFKTAVRQSDSTVRKRASARGQALDQDLANAGASVMPSTVGEGGSTAVNSLGMLGALGIGTFGGSAGAAGTLGALAASPAIYTETGQKALRYMLARPTTANQRLVADFLRKTAPATRAAGTVALSSLTNGGK